MTTTRPEPATAERVIVIDTIERVVARPPSTARPVPRWFRPVGTALAVVLIVAGLGLVAGATLDRGPAAPPETTDRGPVEAPSSPAARVAALPPSTPVALAIPAVGVSSRVNESGLAADGSLEVPAPGPLYDEAAWFDDSVTPGQVGPSVILGHVDSAENGPSVFYELGKLRPGDDVVVTRADGSRPTFRVEALRSYPKDAFPTDTVYGGTVDPELRLITCGGDFDRAAGSYRDNTVVFARLVA